MLAEVNALKMHAMTMSDWVKELDSFLTMTHNDILNHKGKVSHEQALEKAHKEAEEIWDGNLQCIDMYYYSKDLKKR